MELAELSYNNNQPLSLGDCMNKEQGLAADREVNSSSSDDDETKPLSPHVYEKNNFHFQLGGSEYTKLSRDTLLDDSLPGIAETAIEDGDIKDTFINNKDQRTAKPTCGIMGKLYSPESGSDGDVETDPNMDFSHKSKSSSSGKGAARFSMASSIDSLDDDRDGRTTDDAKTASPHSQNGIMSTLEIDRGHVFNIPPPPSTHVHDTFLPMATNAVPPSESSGSFSHHSCMHHQHNGSMRDTDMRDTDSDNNRQKGGCEYHATSLLRIHPNRQTNNIGESYSHGCQHCHDNQLRMMPPHHGHLPPNCCGGHSQPHGSWTHYRQNIPMQHPASMRTSTNSSHYQGTTYEPPWDLVYPSFSQIGMLKQHAANCNHDNLCSHNNVGSCSTLPTKGKERNSGDIMSRSTSIHDKSIGTCKRQNSYGGRNNGLNTLATTTGSHNYETPWDLQTDDVSSASKILAYWQGRQALNSQKLDDSSEGTAPSTERKTRPARHMPPPCSPPPPPPGSEPRHLATQYDALALQQANYIHRLPTKKKSRRCDWRCISVFLLLAVLALAACLAAFTYLLVDRANSPTKQSKGAHEKQLSVTDSNLGDRHRSEIPPDSFVKVRFYVSKSQFHKFNISLAPEAVIGVYGRRGVEPTHIRYQFLEKVLGQQVASSSARKRRSVEVSPSQVNTAFVHYLDEGYWYLSFYNDGPNTENIKFIVNRHNKMSTDCPNDCHGKGDCEDGLCKCFPGYTGVECSQSVCPVLCSGNGLFEQGECRCFDGWKGVDCSVQSHLCISCSTHGRCLNGECVCEDGWKGDNCDDLDCPSPECSGHGVCHEGRCYCELGHRGHDCGIDESKNFTIACSNDCSGHGTFDTVLQLCKCEKGWMGRDCNEKECTHKCEHGSCRDGKCVCDENWSGLTCTEKLCDKRCELHGECYNGTCVCQPGWNGKHCTLEGCPSNCHGHGDCVKTGGEYKCVCVSGWKGKGCDIQVELQCNDNADNDGDNLSDCFDPDCCSTDACRTAAFCQSAPDPISILQSAPKLHTMATFYESKRFLVQGDDDNRVQSPGGANVFDPKRVSIIRGQVLLKDGSPALGTRVEIAQQSLVGFTVTRENGTFDIMVNGGGSVTVLFIRGAAVPANATVIVPWNTLITLDPVTLLQNKDTPVMEPSCDPGHDRYKLYPIVLPTWQHSQLRACPETSIIVPESQVAQESLSVPGTDLHLLYKTSDTAGYKSMVLIQLTPAAIPDNLALVHLKVSVEGLVETKVFEADTNLTYTYAWQRRNAYHQNVYGIVTAHVAVGYQYTGCNRVFWDRQATTLSGFLGGDLSSSDRSVSKGWSLDIQHFYNYQEGILHKGDGTNIYLKEKPRELVTVLGDGLRRDEKCNDCNGRAVNKELLAPVAIASDLDGVVYVADYNMIRRLDDDSTMDPLKKTVSSVLELSGATTSYRYYMTVSPVDGMLYLTDFQNKQVLKVKSKNPGSRIDITTNYEVVAGTGQTCNRGSSDRCGDGGPATQAQLTNPKGIAVNKFGEIYFVDDTSIRKIRKDGVINTVIGSHTQPGQYVPMPCGRSAELFEVFLGWPTSIAFSPLDGCLYILDHSANLILKVTAENKVVIVAGRPSHCPETNFRRSGLGLLGEDFLQSQRARDADLVALKSMTFAPNGDLYLIESDEQRINRVRVVSTDGYISHYAGGTPKCNCQMSSCQCFDPEEKTAAKALLNNPTSLTVTPNGVVYIADMGNLRVHSVVTILPAPGRSRTYRVTSSEEGQTYVFDRNGFHTQTIDLMTNSVLYNFTMYPQNSLQGALTKVSGIGNQVIEFVRDSSAKLKSIKLNGIVVCKVKVNQNRELFRFTDWNNLTTEYSYELYTGLVQSKHNSKGEVFFYTYDDSGRLEEVITATGETIRLESSVDSKGAMITLTENAAISGTATYNGNSLSLWHGKRSADITYSNDGSLVVEYPSGLVVTLETGNHPTFEGNTQTTLKRKIISSSDGPVHRLEWRYYLRRPNNSTRRLGRKLRVRSTSSTMHGIYNTKHLMVNGNNLLLFEYIEGVHLEVVKTSKKENLVSILYNPSGWPIVITSANSSILPVNITYNSAGQLTRWKQGSYEEERTYTVKGQLQSVKKSADVITRYVYGNGGSQPTDIFLPTGPQYQIKYDTFGNVIQLVSPSGLLHNFQKSINLGFIRHSYFTEFGAGRIYIEDVNIAGNVIRKIYPSSNRRVYYRYSVDGRISETLFDTERLIYSYNPVTHALKSVKLVGSNQLSCDLQYKTNGSLYLNHDVLLTPKQSTLKLADVSYQYDYNRFLRITQINGTLLDGSTRIKFISSYQYSEKTGYVTSIGDYRVDRDLYQKLTRVVIRDGPLRVTRLYDASNLLWSVEVNIEGRQIYKATMTYNALRLIKRWSAVSGSYGQTMDYGYNSDSIVTQVTYNNQKTYKYKYNAQQSLVEVTIDRSTKRIHIDGVEKVTNFNSENYHYDVDGFLISRGSVKYEFNSNGQLTSVRDIGKVDVTYLYDSAGRLLTRNDHYGSTIQFLYADVMRPSRLTHTYNFTSHVLSSLIYDDRGYVMAIDIGSDRYHIMPDHSGTPVAVFNNRGTLVKRREHTLFGEIIVDTNPDLNIVLGFQGGVYDSTSELVYLNERWYLPKLGRWMDSSLPHVFKRMSELPKNPTSLNSHQYHHPINLHVLNEDRMYMKDVRVWLEALGYDLDTLAPRMSFEGQLVNGRNPPASHQALLPLVSAFQCAYEQDMDNFLELSVVPQSKLVTAKHDQTRKRLTPSGNLFSPGIVLFVQNDVVNTQIYGSTPQQETLLVTKVLNGSIALHMNYTSGGKVVHYLFKEDLSLFQADLKALGMQPSTSIYLENNVRVKASRVQHTDSKSGEIIQQAQLIIEGNSTEINIRYGATAQQERDRVLKIAIDRAVQSAWLNEMRIVTESRRSRYQWTGAERNELQEKGRVAGFEAQLIRPTTEYPELADDPSNIRFVKSSGTT